MAEEKLKMSLVQQTNISANQIIHENSIPADGLEIILSNAQDPLTNHCPTVVEQGMHPQILMSGTSEIMFPAQSGIEVVPLYPVTSVFGGYQDHFSPMPL